METPDKEGYRARTKSNLNYYAQPTFILDLKNKRLYFIHLSLGPKTLPLQMLNN